VYKINTEISVENPTCIKEASSSAHMYIAIRRVLGFKS